MNDPIVSVPLPGQSLLRKGMMVRWMQENHVVFEYTLHDWQQQESYFTLRHSDAVMLKLKFQL